MLAANGESINPLDAGFQRVLGGLIVGGIVLLVVKRHIVSDTPVELDQALAVSKHKWRGIWPWVLANSLAGQTLGVSCMQKALETTPAGLVLAITSLTPILVIPLAWFMERERPSRRSIAGGVIAVGAVIALAAK